MNIPVASRNREFGRFLCFRKGQGGCCQIKTQWYVLWNTSKGRRQTWFLNPFLLQFKILGISFIISCFSRIIGISRNRLIYRPINLCFCFAFFTVQSRNFFKTPYCVATCLVKKKRELDWSSILIENRTIFIDRSRGQEKLDRQASVIWQNHLYRLKRHLHILRIGSIWSKILHSVFFIEFFQSNSAVQLFRRWK